ncbi:hypothetical protein pb186bvf_004654 [Paramecium bursaria]
MFSNPFFKTEQPRESHMVEILQKYKSPKNDRQSTYSDNMLGSINESQSYFEQNSLPQVDHVFINPQPIQNYDPFQSRKEQQRITFGDNLNPQNQLQAQKQLNEDDLYVDMTHLKDKVMNMLQKYSVTMKTTDNKKQLKQQFQFDAEKVAQEYSQIIDKFNNPDVSGISVQESVLPPKKEQDLTMMFNLVEEFLIKFKNLSQNQQNQSQLLRSKIAASSHPQSVTPQQSFTPPKNHILIEQQQRFSETNQSMEKPLTSSTAAVKQKAQYQFSNYRQTEPGYSNIQQEAQQQKPLDMTIIPLIRGMDDSFYDQKSISLQRINAKLNQLKYKLQSELEKDNMPYTQKILLDMIQNLNQIIDSQDVQLAKTIVYKIENSIKQLSQNSEGSIQLYKYLNKAILHSKQKQEIFHQRQSTPVQVEYRPSEVFYQSPIKDQDILKTQQTPPRQSENSIKRIFYDTALTKKNQLPMNHPGRKYMVSDLFEEYQQSGSGDVYQFLNKKFGM